MRISNFVLVLAGFLVLPQMAGAGTQPFQSTEEALKQGISAYQGGYYETALPALQHAADAHEFMAEYFLARIYADNTGAYTDHAKAYQLFQRLADENAEVDPDDDPRAPYVGKALTALAGYVRLGLPEIGLNPDLHKAVVYLQNASATFQDEDAQFELAKLQLKGEGLDADVPNAKHWLSILTQAGHAGAQAFLADLLWRGKYMQADPPRALALIAVAVENAPAHERLWIEDIYQNIYCGAGEGVRSQATGIVANWGNRYGRKPEARDGSGLGELEEAPQRTCKNGEPVDPISGSVEKGSYEAKGSDGAPLPHLPEARAFSYGSATGPTLRDVGSSLAPRR